MPDSINVLLARPESAVLKLKLRNCLDFSSLSYCFIQGAYLLNALAVAF